MNILLTALNIAQFLLQHPLTREHPWQSFARFARWQISSRIATGPIAVSFVNDARLLVQPGMSGATGNIYAGLHEFEDMAFVLHVLRSEDLFLDVGANIGSYTVLAAKAVGAQAVAFEPIASTFRHLCDNISLNAIADRVDAKQVCVGGKSGMIAMTSQLDSVNHVMHEHESDVSALVPVTTLDEVLGERVPFMIKLDVEGYEPEVLRGATRILGDPALQCLLIEVDNGVERYGFKGSDVIELVQSHGFSRCAYFPMERRLELSRPSKKARNALFVRDRALVQRRLTQAHTFRVLDRSI